MNTLINQMTVLQDNQTDPSTLDIPMNILKNKIYVITTFWTYPFGGGEEIMYDTMEWAVEFGMSCYWLAFSNSHNKPFEELEVKYHTHGVIINIPGGFSVQTLTDWLYLLKPDIVHHQGHMREQFYMAAEKLRVEFMTGFHFWSGGIILGQETSNIEILKNKDKHNVDPEFEFLLKKPMCNFYCASKFVQEVFQTVTGTTINDIIFASSSIRRSSLKYMDKEDHQEPKYVTMINIHKNKGGDVFLHLLKTCPDIHFMSVCTEHNSDELDLMIRQEIEKRNELAKNDSSYAECLWMERLSDVRKIYQHAKIMLCCSIVDETFCRVVNEAMMNRIPVLSTQRGNIKYLMNDPVIDQEDPDYIPGIDPGDFGKWEYYVKKLCHDADLFERTGLRMEKLYNKSSELVAKEQFRGVVTKTIMKSKEMNIGIFSPWCDQGLGIQSRNYYNLLDKSGLFKISIFGLKPYNADTCIQLQKNPDEWIIQEPHYVYYSPNTREDVKDAEMLEFCRSRNIGKMLIPETCWKRVFEIAKLLRENGVKAYAIPNIEIVRRDEVFKHNYFYKILANNYLCKNIFSDHLDIPVQYIGYGINGMKMRDKDYDGQIIKYLFIGGMNAFSRKNILDCCEGFSMAYKKNQNIRITCTIQMANSLEAELKKKITQYTDHPAITIMDCHMSYQDILNLYYNHHVVFQISKHEGLGLGFYEAITSGTPIVTLKTPPHNEIILDGVNGWTIDCYHKPMTDNSDPLFDSAYVEPEKVCEKILEISDMEKIKKVVETLKQDYVDRLSIDIFNKVFIGSVL
jgi:glycosyltransferase involved in cell wall biosynthesis